MLQGVCVDTGQTAVLTKGESYFLFPNGDKHYYVSRFPNQGAHKGCFQARYFQVVDEEEIVMPEVDRNQVYIAHMFRKKGYPKLELKEYFIEPRKTHCDIYHDHALTEFKGRFPLEWFTDFEEITPEIIKSVSNVEEIVFESEENDLFSVKSEPESVHYEQLSLFN